MTDELKNISTYHDGSQKAWEVTARNRERIQGLRKFLDNMDQFIELRREVLSGADWEVGVWWDRAEMKIRHGWYRGQRSSPGQIASLFPDADWQRTNGYGDDYCNWTAVIGDVAIIIERAEEEAPRKKITIKQSGPVPKNILKGVAEKNDL